MPLSRRSSSNASTGIQSKLTSQIFAVKKRTIEDTKQLKSKQSISKKFKTNTVVTKSELNAQDQTKNKSREFINDDTEPFNDEIEDFDEEEEEQTQVVRGEVDDDFDERKLSQPKAKPRNIEIHAEHLSSTDKILRAFDLNTAYGPSVGMTRLERWLRAKNLGLNPPEDLFLTLKSAEEANIKECLFYGRV